MERVCELHTESARQAVRQLLVAARRGGQALVHDHAHQRHAQGGPDRARELREGGRRAHLPRRHRVLHGQDEHLHHRAQPDAGDDHVPRSDAVRRVGPHPVEQEHPDPEHDRADDRVRPVAADPRDELPRHEARRHRAEHERREHDARGSRRRADHALYEERHEGDRAEHRHADERDADDARPDRPVPEQVEGQDRLTRAMLEPGEERERKRRRRERPDDVAGAPRVLAPAPDEAEQETRRPGRERARPGPVDRVLSPRRPLRHGQVHDEEREPAHRQVDVEDPAPARVVDEEAADTALGPTSVSITCARSGIAMK